MAVNWGAPEISENHTTEQSSQEQDSAVMPVTPTEPVAPRYPTNHVSPATFSDPTTVRNGTVEEVRTSKDLEQRGSEQNVHSTGLWRFFQEEAKQGEAR